MLRDDTDMAKELQSAVERGDIKEFRSLHFIMDANTLGDSESVWKLEITPIDADRIQGNARITSDEAIVQTRMDIMNVAQDEVDRWIKETDGLAIEHHNWLHDTYGSYEEALRVCSKRNRMVAGPDGGVSAKSTLAVIVDGPGDEEWTIMEVRDAIDEEFEWRWVNGI